MEKKVSIVIPVYNNEAYIEKCIQSLCKQSYYNLEIVVVDDGSTDTSFHVLEKLALEDSRILLLHQENKGVSSARNVGIMHASGEYLTFVDGDDYVSSNYIGDLVACAQEHQADMVITGLTMVDTNSQVLGEIVPGEYKRFEHEEWAFRLSAVAAHLYRRQLWEQYEVAFYEGERGEDMPIALFFAAVSENIVTFPKAEYYYVQHEKSAMHNFKGLKNISLPYCALEEMLQKLQQVGVQNSKEFHELFVLRILSTFIQLAKGAEKKEITKLAAYIKRIIEMYYPNCGKNKMTGLFTELDIPFMQKVAVKVLIWTNQLRLLPLFLQIVC